MLLGLYGSFWGYWQLYHKVTFDGENKLIIINAGVTEIDVEQDLYSDWKEWVALEENTKFDYAIRSIGGDPTVGGDFAGATFFVTNGWRVYLDHGVNFTGNLYSDDYDSPFIVETGIQLAQIKVSNLVDKIAPDITGLGAEVWSVTNASGQTYGSAVTQIAAEQHGLTDSQATMLIELYKIMGLDPATPLITTPSSRTAGASVTQTITGDPATNITVTRT